MIEELSIKELKYKIKEIEDELEMYLTLKKIEFNKSQPGAMTYKDIIVQGGQPFDKFTHYLIKSEQYDDNIIELTQKLLAYQTRLAKKIKNICNGDSKAYITYLREEEKYSWEKIARLTHFSIRQARRIYGQK